MWPSITRARRRIGNVLAPASPSGQTTPAKPPATPDRAATTGPAAATATATALEDVVIVLDGHDLDALREALASALGIDDRPDTPAQLGTALSAAIRARGGTATPRVFRLPAGLSTPEAWEIRFDHIEPRVYEAIRDAIRTGRFPA